MRYIVVGDVAILATRGLEKIDGETVHVAVIGVPDGSVFCIQNGGAVKSFSVSGEEAILPANTIDDGVYDVTVIVGTQEQRREISGNPFSIFTQEGERAIIPPPLSTATELERMWEGIVNALETFIPLIDTLQNGNEAV